MSSLQEIEEESKEFARQWRAKMARGSVAILVGAFLYILFSPSNIIEYIAMFMFVTPMLLWAYKTPEARKTRILASILCYVSSVVIYSVWV